MRILASDGMEKNAVAALRAQGHEVVEQFYEPAELAEQVKNFDVLVVRSATKVRVPIIDAACETGKLKLIIRGGVGIDNIDHKYAEEKGIKVQHGVYIGTQGPTFETPAEYKLFHILGADAVGMSTVPEVIVANHCGIKVFGISVITDLGVEGKIVEVTHEEVQKAADAAQPKMTTIMRELINRA